ncbi:MAG: division/cell wall cluster transcriptional repressor MraZ [Clostridia bacterium]|nr:division/cell wall cluster transcriptional repressor MraZ [Clostridia bacterium]
MFYGEYYNKIDSKGRLRMPPKLKEELGNKYLITKGGNGCLFVFSSNTVEKLEEKLGNIPLSDIEAQKPLRMLFSAGFMVEEDNQGRFLIPPKLREFANLSADAAIIGAGSRVEIWDSERWKEYNTCDDFDSMLSNLSKFGV